MTTSCQAAVVAVVAMLCLAAAAAGADNGDVAVEAGDAATHAIRIAAPVAAQTAAAAAVRGPLVLDPVERSGRLIDLDRLSAEPSVNEAGPLTQSGVPGSPRVAISAAATGLLSDLRASRDEAERSASALMAAYCAYPPPFTLAIDRDATQTIARQSIDRQTLAAGDKVTTGYLFVYRLSLDALPVFNGDHNVRVAAKGVSLLSYVALHVTGDLPEPKPALPLTQALVPVARNDGAELPSSFTVTEATLGYLLSGDAWKSTSPQLRAIWRCVCLSAVPHATNRFTIDVGADDGKLLAVEIAR